MLLVEKYKQVNLTDRSPLKLCNWNGMMTTMTMLKAVTMQCYYNDEEDDATDRLFLLRGDVEGKENNNSNSGGQYLFDAPLKWLC